MYIAVVVLAAYCMFVAICICTVNDSGCGIELSYRLESLSRVCKQPMIVFATYLYTVDDSGFTSRILQKMVIATSIYNSDYHNYVNSR